MAKFLFYFGDKTVEITADGMYPAKVKAIAHFKPAKSKQHMVHGVLCEVDGEQVTHSTASVG